MGITSTERLVWAECWHHNGVTGSMGSGARMCQLKFHLLTMSSCSSDFPSLCLSFSIHEMRLCGTYCIELLWEWNEIIHLKCFKFTLIKITWKLNQPPALAIFWVFNSCVWLVATMQTKRFLHRRKFCWIGIFRNRLQSSQWLLHFLCLLPVSHRCSWVCIVMFPFLCSHHLQSICSSMTQVNWSPNDSPLWHPLELPQAEPRALASFLLGGAQPTALWLVPWTLVSTTLKGRNHVLFILACNRHSNVCMNGWVSE